MRFLFIISIILLCGVAMAQKPKVKISGTVTFRHIYKGGAAPSQEILDRCCNPQPFSNKVLYIKKNYYSAPYYILHTDSAGHFVKKIRTGTYKLYLNNEVNSQQCDSLAQGKGDENMKWLTDPYAIIKVTSQGKKHFEINLVERRNGEILPP